MVAATRHDAILRELELRGTLTNAALAARLGVSMMTLRRDLSDLERRGLLRRVHGGATSLAMAAQQRTGAAVDGRTPARPLATIGMLVPTTVYYFPEIIRGASQAASELGCRLVVGATNYSVSEELRQAERMLASGVDAIMITPRAELDDDSPLVRLLADADRPVVLVERSPDERSSVSLDWVRSDHVAGAETAVRHLLSLGHQRIVLAARPAATTAALREGFARATSGLDDDGGESTALWHPLPTPPQGVSVSLDDIRRLIDTCHESSITAVIVLGDADAMAVADQASARGLSVPDDLAIIAYDDEISAHAQVPLTAVAPPKRELGSTALRLCVDRLRQQVSAPRRATRMVLLPTLIVRESTASRTSATD